jgi:hypothetical protein
VLDGALEFERRSRTGLVTRYAILVLVSDRLTDDIALYQRLYAACEASGYTTASCMMLRTRFTISPPPASPAH